MDSNSSSDNDKNKKNRENNEIQSHNEPCSYYVNYQFDIGDTDNYLVESKIGRGRYSDVYEGQEKKTSKKVVIKILKPITKIKIIREICILKTLKKCPNIVEITDVIKEQNSDIFCIICKSISGIELKNCYLGISPSDLKNYMYKIIQCLEYAHSKNIIHRDIKSTNIAINQETKELNIFDWGLSDFYIKDYKYTLTIGSRYYKAPELLMEYKKYDFSIDMWSVGCLFGALLFQIDYLFKGDSNQDQLVKIAKQLGYEEINKFLEKYQGDCFLASKIKNKIKGYNRKNWDEFINEKNKYLINNEALDLLNKLLEIDHQKRIKAKEALNHSYFKS
jgi:casein kinase II subunit alpha